MIRGLVKAIRHFRAKKGEEQHSKELGTEWRIPGGQGVPHGPRQGARSGQAGLPSQSTAAASLPGLPVRVDCLHAVPGGALLLHGGK